MFFLWGTAADLSAVIFSKHMSRKDWAIVIAVVLIAATGGGAAVAFAIKPGVTGKLEWEMDPVIPVVSTIWRAHGLKIPTITSIGDGVHASNSKHYVGLAVDFRLNDVPPDIHNALATEVAAALGPKFFVLHEYHGTAPDHLHIQYNG